MPVKFIIGIDLGGTNLKAALLDSKYRIHRKEARSTKAFRKKESLILAIIDSINKVTENIRLDRADILGVGLGLPGPIDNKKGVVHFFPNIPGWRQVNLKSILEKRLRLPVFLDNDAKLMALAEYRLGRAKGASGAVCLTLGTGVGAGIIIDKKLYRGANNAAGEIGHIPINEAGPSCNCGGSAHLEAYIGNNRILSEAKKIFGRSITLEGLSALAAKGNKQAKDIWLRVAKRLGNALAGVVNLLNPDRIIIGGGVAQTGKVLFDNVRKAISKQAMSVQAKHVKLFKAKLGNDAGLIGAAILVKESIDSRGRSI